ncbi:MAG TPA: hypothetical protein VMW05_09350 [Methyloceanibacter sp.]|nr:hypothetical protein [Methyloceanibacter sp.]
MIRIDHSTFQRHPERGRDRDRNHPVATAIAQHELQAQDQRGQHQE